jgi:protein-disulfide isomerase
MRKIWFAALTALVAIVLSPAAAPAADLSPNPADAQGLLTVTPNDRILGTPDAPITIIEYASMTCPHCAHFDEDVLPAIKKKWIDTGKVRLVLRDFPLDDEAVHASMIARCAPPKEFYAYIDTFFNDQEQWVEVPNYQAELTRLAELGGMGKDQVDKCLNDKALENQVLASRLAAANQLGVDATPTFFINGTKFTGEPTVAKFDQLLAGLSQKS